MFVINNETGDMKFNRQSTESDNRVGTVPNVASIKFFRWKHNSRDVMK